MRVSRSDVSCFVSIQRESSRHRRERDVGVARRQRRRAGAAAHERVARRRRRVSMRDGVQIVAGASSGSRATLRGPVRRSSSGASDRCQLDAASSRSRRRIVTCTSFSASANVAADTGGPVTGPVPNVGGAPGVDGSDAGAGVGADAEGGWVLHAAVAAATIPKGAVIRNCLRVFMMRAPGISRWRN